MGDAYTEHEAQQGLIEKVMKEEEESFLRTLETGIKLLERNLPEKEGGVLSGEVAFKLYDTFGFPLDLTELILREHGMSTDVAGFNAEMQKQKDRARNAAAVETGDWTKVHDGEPEFVGYDEIESTAHILRYRAVKQKKSEFYQIVLSRSPFYAEMGGQVGDSGWLISETGEKIEVFDTKRENNLAVHLTKKLPQNLEGMFTAKIDTDKRTATECNHSATHLMHEALREVLGNHVEQKGSYVSPEVLRFDFSHFQKMTPEEIRAVEVKVTEKIRSNFPIEEHRHVPIEEAKAQGAMALFGEKYGDDVRTVRFGTSIELCGGTHISSTGRIGTFRIVSEGAISAGVRRIEAVTAKVCEDYLYAKEDILTSIKNLLSNVPDVMQGINRLIADNEEMKKELQEFIKEKTEQVKLKVIEHKTVINGVDVFKAILPVGSPDVIKDIAFQIKGQFPENMIFVGATAANGKPNLTVMLTDDLVAKGMHAGNIVREAAKLIQGGGGGQPHFATAGGKNAERLNEAIESIIKLLKS
jgi:alanyl-tRNA synthetase